MTQFEYMEVPIGAAAQAQAARYEGLVNTWEARPAMRPLVCLASENHRRAVGATVG